MKKIVIASGNSEKIREAREILNGYEIVSMKDLGIDIDVEEDQDSFEKNAIKKSVEIGKTLEGQWCLADDSGIEIEYLDGFPGVYTKRWHSGSDRERNLEIIKKLEGISKQNRKVKFTTALALSDGKNIISATGIIRGYISEKPRGNNGFGFDEIFELESGKTLAELNSEKKNEISARRIALEDLKSKIKEI